MKKTNFKSVMTVSEISIINKHIKYLLSK